MQFIMLNQNRFECSLPGLRDAVKNSSIEKTLKKQLYAEINKSIFLSVLPILGIILVLIALVCVLVNIDSSLQPVFAISASTASLVIFLSGFVLSKTKKNDKPGYEMKKIARISDKFSLGISFTDHLA